MRKVFFSIVLAMLALVAPASAAAATPTFELRNFGTAPGAASDLEMDITVPSDQPAIAKVVIYVPAGYGLNTGVAPGTTVGTVDAVAQIGSTTVTIPTGNIVADTPANYTSNPEAQACAPGAHAAVWVAHAASFAIPLYVDPTSSTESSLGAFKLQACFTSPDSPGAAAGARLTEAILGFVHTVFNNPTAQGIYFWRTIVVPYTPGTAAPNPAGAYELRSAVFIPATLTIKNGGYNKKTKKALVTGKFLLLGKPLKGITVGIVQIGANGNVKLVGRPKTNKKGIYKLSIRLTKATVFGAVVVPGTGSCDASPPPAAPGGCVSETDTSFFSNTLRVVPKK